VKIDFTGNHCNAAISRSRLVISFILISSLFVSLLLRALLASIG